MLGLGIVFGAFSWIAFSCLAAWIAHDKGRYALGFFVVSLIFSPVIGVIAALGAQVQVRSPSRNRVFTS